MTQDLRALSQHNGSGAAHAVHPSRMENYARDFEPSSIQALQDLACIQDGMFMHATCEKKAMAHAEEIRDKQRKETIEVRKHTQVLGEMLNPNSDKGKAANRLSEVLATPEGAAQFDAWVESRAKEAAAAADTAALGDKSEVSLKPTTPPAAIPEGGAA